MGKMELKKMGVNGADLHYIEKGEGPPVIFIHGDLTDYRIWEAQIEPFSKHFRAISYSRRYHYPNSWTGDGSDYSAALHADDLAEFIKQLGGAPAHLIASSWGAVVAMILSVDHPDLVKTLVLCEPALIPWLQTIPGGEPYLNNFIEAIKIMQTTFLEGKNIEKGIREGFDVAWGQGTFDRFPGEVKEITLSNAPSFKAEISSPNLSPSFTPEDAKRIQTKTLLVKGEHSPPFFSLISDEVCRFLPHSERVTISNVSHFMFADNPEAFNSKVCDFLLRND